MKDRYASLAKNFHEEEWHTPKGRSIREVVFGLNDGLVTTLGFLAGVTGSIANKEIILLAGLAEIAAGAISMSTGAYISSKSQKEFYEREIARERREIEEDPEHEKSEIKQIYSERGFTEEEIAILTRRITADKEQWLRFMLREELGLGHEAFESPMRVGITMGSSFLLGSVIPLLPYFFLPPASSLVVATIGSILFLFCAGAFKTRITRGRWFRSGLEMVLIGAAATIVGYFLGTIVANLTGK